MQAFYEVVDRFRTWAKGQQLDEKLGADRALAEGVRKYREELAAYGQRVIEMLQSDLEDKDPPVRGPERCRSCLACDPAAPALPITHQTPAAIAVRADASARPQVGVV